MQKMNTTNEIQLINTTTLSEEHFSWKEYGHYHDYFIQLLSYNQKHNYTNSNIWEFSYV